MPHDLAVFIIYVLMLISTVKISNVQYIWSIHSELGLSQKNKTKLCLSLMLMKIKELVISNKHYMKSESQ